MCVYILSNWVFALLCNASTNTSGGRANGFSQYLFQPINFMVPCSFKPLVQNNESGNKMFQPRSQLHSICIGSKDNLVDKLWTATLWRYDELHGNLVFYVHIDKLAATKYNTNWRHTMILLEVEHHSDA